MKKKRVGIRKNYYEGRIFLQKFRELFGFSAPIDMHISSILHKVVLDIVALNDILNVPDDTSLDGYISKKYGNEAARLVYDWIKLM